MDRGFAVIAVATAFLLLAASAERPVGLQTSASRTATTSTLALPPAGHHQRPTAFHDEGAATKAAGKRQPFVAAHHLPAAASSPHRPLLPWAGAAEAEAAGEPGLRGKGTELLRRQRQSYVGGGTTTDQEQLAMEASASTGWVPAPAPAPGASDVADDDEPAKMMANTVDGEAELPELLNPDEPWLQNHCLVDRHDFNTGGREYNRMMWHINFCLIKFTDRRSSVHWVLCPEPSDPNDAPCAYVIVPLRGLDGDECALALRADNLDIAAFANGRNKWHVFKRYMHLMPTATVLDFDNDYNDLLGTESNDAKMSIQLGDACMLESASQISRYRRMPGNNERYVKLAIATMKVGITEAKRLTPVREVIVSAWLEGTTLNEKMAQYLTRWKDLSCALLVAEKGGAWGADKYSTTLIDLGIAKSKQDALYITELFLSSDCP